MSYDPTTDKRLNPRVRGLLAAMEKPLLFQAQNAKSREDALAIANSREALAVEAAMLESMELMDDDRVFPSLDLRISHETITSFIDGHCVPLKFIRPDTDDKLPCVLYIHGGAMAMMSFEHATYRAWGKALAHQQVCVVMVDFRNSLRPSTTDEVAPFPAGLNDCISGYHWVQQNADSLGINANQILIAGDSGGGNLAIATTMSLVRAGQPPLGLYALCPYILGQWPDAEHPSSSEFEGYLISVHNNHATMGYGIDAYRRKDPLAWPGFATVDDLRGFPPTLISVNECDPLRDEGIEFYRKLLEANVYAHCRQMMGTVHANEMFTTLFPDVTRMTARDIRGWISECDHFAAAAAAAGDAR